MHQERMERVRGTMRAQGVDALLLSVGPDLPWLTGYEAMPLERLTMLVVPREGEATLVVPRLEAPRVVERPDVFGLRPWGELEDPIALVADLVGPAGTVGVGDRTWSRFLLELQGAVGGATRWQRAAPVVGPLRARKDPGEVTALREAARAADRVAAQLQGGEIRLAGRTEAEVSAEIGRRLVDEGHQRVNFAIVATGPNAASPHHEAGSDIITPGQVLLCDFGGLWPTESGAGYCSDITRCVAVGPPAAEVVEAYSVLQEAQAASVASAKVGVTCEDVDAAARSPIASAGYGDRFIHRTGHGIGVEEHEDPYIVEGNRTRLEPGHAFSVEPGIYTPGAWGLRIEDIVVATEAGPLALNRADHDLIVVDV
ncbi:Xaa-Pro peptidase family protein [Iamia sp. SCSIO 61187]|uniref:M24 family metallopeptidase n=1 Tax=Iamia sp. SCSIO 61187 TaxID=2722752 RepID=UPI001C63B21F|nr:Xaa-Pro peptidase family protein [Iamia sp. SCSIO 61187]